MTEDAIVVPKKLREQEEAYCDGYIDGWWKGREATHTETDPFTRRDWWLWVAAVFGFIVGMMV